MREGGGGGTFDQFVCTENLDLSNTWVDVGVGVFPPQLMHNELNWWVYCFVVSPNRRKLLHSDFII